METEKIYLTMKHSGASSLILGILSICFGIAAGGSSDRLRRKSPEKEKISEFLKIKFESEMK